MVLFFTESKPFNLTKPTPRWISDDVEEVNLANNNYYYVVNINLCTVDTLCQAIQTSKLA